MATPSFSPEEPRLPPERIRQELADRWMSSPGPRTSPGPIIAFGIDGKVVNVNLRADQEAVAAELLQQYGDSVRISVGSKCFPPNRPLSEEEQRVEGLLAEPRVEPEVIEVPGLVISLELDDSSIRSGTDGHGCVVLSNDGSETIDFSSGQPLVGSVLHPETGKVVGGYVGILGGTGLEIHLRPGEKTQIGVIFGTAAASDQEGYVMPPGRYLVRVDVPVYEGEPGYRIWRIPVSPVELVVIDASA